MFLSVFYDTLALAILAATYKTVPPCLSITPPRYAKESTSSNRSSSGVDPHDL